MKALHEFKTEKEYKDYLIIYFSGIAMSHLIEKVSKEEWPVVAVSNSCLVHAKSLIEKLSDHIKFPDKTKKINSPVNTIKDRMSAFSVTLQPFVATYGKDMMNEFYKYWTEPNKSGSRFRMEMQDTWSLKLRLETWAKNQKIDKNGKSTEAPTKLTYTINATK